MPTDPLEAAPPLLTAEAMRAADAYTTGTLGLPGFTLMESAGRAAARVIARAYAPIERKTVTVFCGKGNNGGDGLVAARRLHALGARVRALILNAEAMTDDAAQNLRLLEQIAEQDAAERLRIARFESLSQLAAFRPAHVHVDALLGTGLTSALREPVRSLATWLNRQPQPVVAIDVPTGLHTDTGQVLGTAVRAERTVTMGALKAGLVLGDGPHVAGHVATAEIGIPRHVLDRDLPAPGCARYPEDAQIAALLPRRAPDAHKYSAGMALVVGGTPGMTGAPVMSSRAAARAGAGYVACAAHEGAQPALAAKLTTIPTVALPAGAGGLRPEAALEALGTWLDKARALLVGPGMGRAGGTQQFIRRLLEHVLEQTELPAVIDADGLNAIDDAWLAEHGAPRLVLTPHAGEFKRLAGAEADFDLGDPVRTAQRYAARWGCVLLLKGQPSVVAAPDGRALVCRTGGPALATAGTGDVLAGLCAGLLAQGLAPLQAAICALHLGGAAAERYARRRAPSAMIATDLLDQLPHVLHDRLAPGTALA